MEQLLPGEFTRLANNFYNQKNMVSDINRIVIDSELSNYLVQHRNEVNKKYKVAFVYICLNPFYWEYAKPMVEGAKQFFLPGHDVDFFFWSDLPKQTSPELQQRVVQELIGNQIERGIAPYDFNQEADKMIQQAIAVNSIPNVTVFPIEGMEWPAPTLMRYHLFLQQEETLSKYDYIFYCDIDMRFVGVVGDEILGDGLTAAQHPMYAFDKSFYPPYEPNKESAAYIPRPGLVIMEQGKPRFMPLYFAGGLQGGKSKLFIEAMKAMRKNIDADFNRNYVAIWNDESHWNRYLFDNPPSVVLSPSYIYPDSLVEEYYVPRWGVRYPPKLMTLTKRHTLRKLSPEDQARLTMMK